LFRCALYLLDTGILPAPFGLAKSGVCGKEPSKKPYYGFFSLLPSQTQRRALCNGTQKRQFKAYYPKQNKKDPSGVFFVLSMGYKKDIFAVFAYEFEPSP